MPTGNYGGPSGPSGGAMTQTPGYNAGTGYGTVGYQRNPFLQCLGGQGTYGTSAENDLIMGGTGDPYSGHAPPPTQGGGWGSSSGYGGGPPMTPPSARP